jgi:hypothetical protein
VDNFLCKSAEKLRRLIKENSVSMPASAIKEGKKFMQPALLISSGRKVGGSITPNTNNHTCDCQYNNGTNRVSFQDLTNTNNFMSSTTSEKPKVEI